MRKMLEKDVHRLVHRMAHKFKEFLMNVNVADRCFDPKIRPKRCRTLGPCDRERTALLRNRKCAFQRRIALRWSERDYHIMRSRDRRDKSLRRRADVECGKRALSYQNGVNELDRKVHRVGRVGAATKSQ